ncbi:MAG: hypothetical protein AAGA53_10145 [Pseudomonadota bacterium]
MTRKIITAVAVAASVLATVSVAEAGGKNKGRHFGGKHFYGHVWHDYYGHRPVHNCRYFLKKAQYTGSPYWFKKYRRCINVYY